MSSGNQSEALRKLIANFPKDRKSLKSQMLWLRYFSEAKEFSSGRELDQIVTGVLESSSTALVKVQKGTVLYRKQDKNDVAYMLLSGAVGIYSAKTEGEKTEWIKRNKRLTAQAKTMQACRLTGFAAEQIVQSLIETFIDDKIHFAQCHHLHTINPGQYFGFPQLVKLGYRPFSAIALLDCHLLTISKPTFQKHLLEFQKMKQSWMIEMLSSQMDPQKMIEVKSMFTYLTPYIFVKECNNEEVMFREGQPVIDAYMIVRGELETFKELELGYPKEYASRELKSVKSKTVSVTVARSVPGQLVGEEELVVNCRTRTYTVKALTGDTLLFKIDAGFFLKLLNERYDILKMISKRAKEKMAMYNKTYSELSQKITQGFKKQFRDYEEKKQDILVEKVVGNDRITSQQIECLKQQQPGIFFRDTFQKLQRMDLWTTPSGHIKPHPKRQRPVRGTSLPVAHHQSHTPLNLDITTHQRMLFSTKKNINQAELMVNFLQHEDQRARRRAEIIQHRRNSSLSPPRLSLKSFKADKLKMDERVEKRVLIKRGVYKRESDKKYMPFKVATQFEENFGPVIESCIAKKNGSISRIQEPKKRKEIVDLNYRTMVKKCKNRAQDQQSLQPVRMFHSWTIKDLRKTFSTMSKHKTSRQMDNSSFHSPMRSTRISIPSHKQILQQFDCIIAPSKIKRQGKFSYETVQYQDEHVREYYTAQIQKRLEMNRTTPKLVLLNHMMKPISYNK